MEPRRSQGRQSRGMYVCVVGLMAALALLVPAGASAASPVLEFVVPGHALPVAITTGSDELNAEMEGFSSLVHCGASHGEGEITGPRSTISNYRFTECVTQRGSNQKCKSAGAQPEEITTGLIEADLVWIDQAKDEVGILLDPLGGAYIAFECGGESAEGRGPFLAPVGPIDKDATSFTATLGQSASMQTPDEYEGEHGEKLKATPMGDHGNSTLVPTGVELAMTVIPSFSGEIRALTAVQEAVEEHARQAGEEAKHQEEAALAKKDQEEAAAAATKKHQEEGAAAVAATKKQEEEAAAKKQAEEEKTKSKRPTRSQLLVRALKQCKKDKPKHKRMRCEKLATNKYGNQRKNEKPRK